MYFIGKGFIMNKLLVNISRGFLHVLSCLPLKFHYFMGDILAWLLKKVFRYRYSVVLINIISYIVVIVFLYRYFVLSLLYIKLSNKRDNTYCVSMYFFISLFHVILFMRIHNTTTINIHKLWEFLLVLVFLSLLYFAF